MSKILTKEVKSAINKLNEIKKEVGTYVVEREDVLHIITLALVTHRNVFFLGETGQAKSYAVREVMKRIDGSKYFEQLFNKMIDKDEIFGRLDIPSLVKGIQKLIVDGKIPEADVNFFDEFFKANEVLLNTLLQVLNYEDITLEGQKYHLPTIANFTASNEIPNFKKEEDMILKPLYDRLHLKMITNYIEEKNNYKSAVKQKRAGVGASIKATISVDELRNLYEKAQEVNISEAIDDMFWDICEAIKSTLNKTISDRKKLEYSIIVQGQALLNGRDEVLPEDLKILKWYLWDSPEEILSIEGILKRFTENPLKDKLMSIKSMAQECVQEALKIADDKNNIKARNKLFVKAENELVATYVMFEKIKDDIKTLDDKKMYEETEKLIDEIYKDLLRKFGYTEISLVEQVRRQGY